MCWATFIAILGHMQFAGRRLDTPGMWQHEERKRKNKKIWKTKPRSFLGESLSSTARTVSIHASQMAHRQPGSRGPALHGTQEMAVPSTPHPKDLQSIPEAHELWGCSNRKCKDESCQSAALKPLLGMKAVHRNPCPQTYCEQNRVNVRNTLI